MTVLVGGQLEMRNAYTSRKPRYAYQLVFRTQRCSRRYSAGTCWASSLPPSPLPPSDAFLVSTEPQLPCLCPTARVRVAKKFWIPSASRASFLSVARRGGDRLGEWIKVLNGAYKARQHTCGVPLIFKPYQTTGGLRKCRARQLWGISAALTL